MNKDEIIKALPNLGIYDLVAIAKATNTEIDFRKKQFFKTAGFEAIRATLKPNEVLITGHTIT